MTTKTDVRAKIGQTTKKIEDNKKMIRVVDPGFHKEMTAKINKIRNQLGKADLDGLMTAITAIDKEVDDLLTVALTENDTDDSEDYITEVLEEFNKRYRVLKHGGNVYVLEDTINDLGHHDYALFRPSSLRDFHANVNFNIDSKEQNSFDTWLKWEDRNTCSGITFDPRTTDVLVNGKFNSWSGFSIEPEAGNDDDIYWELVKVGMCNNNTAYYQYVRKYLAHMIQKPWERPLTAIGIYSKQGAGKGAFVGAVGSLLGPHYNETLKMEDVVGKFTGGIRGIILGFLDEASWGGDKSKAGELKRTITSTQDRIELKGKDSANVPSYKRLFFASNTPYYYHADPDDRRLLPLEPNEQIINKGNKEFWERYWDTFNNGKLRQNLLHTLMNEDIQGFNPYTDLRDMEIGTGWETMYNGLQPHEKWIYHAINDRAFSVETEKPTGGTMVVQRTEGKLMPTELHSSYKLYCDGSHWDRIKASNFTNRMIGQYITSIMGKSQAIKGARYYKIDWDMMKDKFAEQYRFPVEWDEQIEQGDLFDEDGRSNVRSLERAKQLKELMTV